MYRKTLALSLTSLFCLPALAQSGVQLYGSADAFFKYGKVMGDSTAGIDDGVSATASSVFAAKKISAPD